MSRGRPRIYEPLLSEQAKKLCLYGATDVEVADFFGIAVSTLYKWKHDFPEFSEALKSGKESADDRVERSLYHRAIGYSFDALKIAVNSQGDVTKVPYREHLPPDTTAGIFWLKNRRKDQWRDRHEFEVGDPGDFDRLSDDDLRKLIATEIGSGSGMAAGIAPSRNTKGARSKLN